MNKILETKNRRNNSVFYHMMDDHVIVSCPSSVFTRFGGDPDKLSYVDFEGGPFISVGLNLSDVWSRLPSREVVKIEPQEAKIKLILK